MTGLHEKKREKYNKFAYFRDFFWENQQKQC